MGYTINDVKNDECYFNLETERFEPMEELLEKWNGLSEEERLKMFTAKKKAFDISGEYYLEQIFEDLEESDFGYDGMFCNLMADATEDFKARFQAILDEIENFPCSRVYEPHKPINPYVDLKEDEHA